MAAPFLLLHLLVLCARIFESKVTGAADSIIRLPGGRPLRVYRRDKPNSRATLVFIHGSPATADAFHAQFKDSFGDVSLLAYDRPGYGGSPPIPDSNNLQAQVGALGSLLNAIESTNCVLIGHSYGGAIALKAAIDYPEFVRGILLIGGSVDPAQERVLLVQRVGAWTKDRLVPPANVGFLEHELTRVGKAHLFAKVIVRGGNHFLPWEHPEIVHNAVHDLLRACEVGHQDLPKSVLR